MLTDQPVSCIHSDGGSPRQPHRVSDVSLRVVTLRGEFDASNADALWNHVSRAINAHTADLALHLGAVSFLDASTLTVFIKARAKLESEDRRFSLRSPSPSAIRILEICDLRSLVDDDATSQEP